MLRFGMLALFVCSAAVVLLSSFVVLWLSPCESFQKLTCGMLLEGSVPVSATAELIVGGLTVGLLRSEERYRLANMVIVVMVFSAAVVALSFFKAKPWSFRSQASIQTKTPNKSLQLTFDPPPIFASAKNGVASNAAELKR